MRICRADVLTSFFTALEEISCSANLGLSGSHEILGWHVGFSVRRVERKFLPRRFGGGQNATILRRTTLDHRDQLHFSSNPCAKDDRQLETAYSRKFSFCPKSTAKDHPLVEAARLRRHAGILLQSRDRLGRATRTSFVSAAAHVQKRCGRAELVSSRISLDACRIRVPS